MSAGGELSFGAPSFLVFGSFLQTGHNVLTCSHVPQVPTFLLTTVYTFPVPAAVFLPLPGRKSLSFHCKGEGKWQEKGMPITPDATNALHHSYAVIEESFHDSAITTQNLPCGRNHSMTQQ